MVAYVPEQAEAYGSPHFKQYPLNREYPVMHVTVVVQLLAP